MKFEKTDRNAVEDSFLVFDPSILAMRYDAGPHVPAETLQDAIALSKSSCSPNQAREGLERFLPVLEANRLNEDFVLACATLVEKQRFTEGMLGFWSGMQMLLHEHDMPLRMLMRWYRRGRQIEEGVIRLRQLLPDDSTDTRQAERMVLGMSELQLFCDLDVWARQVLPGFPEAVDLRLAYVRSLSDQGRFVEATEQAAPLRGLETLSSSQRKLLDAIGQKAQTMSNVGSLSGDGVVERLIELAGSYPVRPLSPENHLGNVVFFTGQLGAGGAERQLARVATAMHSARRDSGRIGKTVLDGTIKVCVRHTTPATASDFFLPVLREAQVDVTTLVDEPMLGTKDLPDYIDREFRDLLDLMPRDLVENTCKLISYFLKNQTEVAYIWQDGGVMTAAIAALAAGVPRVVASFRGQPPNRRPELMRQHMPALFKALSSCDRVCFSANSHSTARSYEEWLEMEKNSIHVVYNTTPAILPDGSAGDADWWADVCARSPQCHQTVLGVFRYDHNKRPQFWIEIAMEMARRNAHVRFVILGAGVELDKCRVMIKTAGMQDRVFLAGPRCQVGYFMHRADLLMHLARMEGLPNAIIEAQLSGLAVLATPAGGTDEIISHGVTGHILSDNQNPPRAEILDKLGELLENPDTLQAMGQAGCELSATRFLLDQVLNDTISLFKEKL